MEKSGDNPAFWLMWAGFGAPPVRRPFFKNYRRNHFKMYWNGGTSTPVPKPNDGQSPRPKQVVLCILPKKNHLMCFVGGQTEINELPRLPSGSTGKSPYLQHFRGAVHSLSAGFGRT